jgi:tetratricopeptide (TPR) repeat protein
MLPQPHWHEAEVQAALRGQRWFQAVHHLERGRSSMREARAQDQADFVLAGTLHNLAQALRDRGLNTLAISAYRRSLAITDRLVRDQPRQTRYRRDRANTEVHFGRALVEEGQLDEAEKLVRRGVKDFEAVVKADPDNAWHRSDLVFSHHSLADVLNQRKKRDEAIKEMLCGVEFGRQLARDHPEHMEGLYQLSACCHNLANLYTQQDQDARAIAYYREARTLLEKVAGPSSRLSMQADHGNTLLELGRALQRQGKGEEGRQAGDKGIKLLRRLAERPGAPNYIRVRFVEALERYGHLLKRGPHPDDVEEIYEEALQRGLELLRETPDQQQMRGFVSAIWHNLAHYFLMHGQRPHAALRGFRRAEGMLDKLVAEAPEQVMYRRDLANTRLFLGSVLAALGKRLEAQSKLRRSAKDWEALARDHKNEPEYGLSAAQARGELALLRGKFDDVEREAEAMVKSKNRRERSPYTAACLLARCAERLAKAGEQGRAQSDRCGSRAVALVGEALREKRERPEHVQRDPELAFLRSRADYQKLFEKK